MALHKTKRMSKELIVEGFPEKQTIFRVVFFTGSNVAITSVIIKIQKQRPQRAEHSGELCG